VLSLASLALALAASTAPATGTCVGPCEVPNCPNSTFSVCHETPGKTKVYASNGGATIISTQENSATFGVGVLGAVVQPMSPKTWGDVDECSDMEGDCV